VSAKRLRKPPQGDSLDLSILHLSDIHFSNKKLKDYSIVRAALLKRIAALREERKASPDIVIFSGDLVQGGQDIGDFATAKHEFIDPILAAANVPSEAFLIVPGNHDIDREVVRGDTIIEGGQRTALRNRDALNQYIDKYLAADPSTHAHFERLHAYFSFLKSHKFAENLRVTPFFSSHKLTVRNQTIGVACLNTAWRCSGEPDDTDYGQLLLGERSLFESLNDLQNCDLKVAVFHHPTGWLRSFDREDCRPLLLKEFDLILTGHCHEQRPEFVSTPTGKAVISEGGALYVHRKWFNGFCWIDYTSAQNKAAFSLWRYEDSNAMQSFEPATNVAPGGTYAIALNSAEEIERFASVETTCKALRPAVTELANEHMLSNYTESDAPKSLEELYVPARIARRSQYEAAATAPEWVSEAEILASDVPYLIYGPRESGKTTLAWHLCLVSISAERKRIPVIIDAAKIKAGSKYILRSIRQFTASAAQTDFEEHLKQGNLLIVFDNIIDNQADSSSQRKLAMVETFIAEYPKNRYVLFGLEAESASIRLSKPLKMTTAHQVAYLHPLHSSGIRALSKRWLEPSGLHTTTNVKAVIQKIRAFNLPQTPHVVSMVLWTIEKERNPGPLNEASLLQRFVEANLNKTNPAELGRGSIDYLIKETFLSLLAAKLHSAKASFLKKNDVVAFAIDFFTARSWKDDAAKFVDGLIRIGILVPFEDDDETYLEFRYRCLQEYFMAVYLRDNEKALDAIFEADEFLTAIREIDILTGLTRNNQKITDKLLVRMAALEPDLEISLSGILERSSTLQMKYGDATGASLAIASDIEAAKATDAEVQALADKFEEQHHHVLTAKSAKKEGRSDTETILVKYFLNTLLLSKVVRNNELIDNEASKLIAVREAIKGWTYFCAGPSVDFDDALAGKSIDEHNKLFAKLNEKEKAQAEFLMKVLLPVVTMQFASEAINTDKLSVILNKVYDELPVKDTYRRLVLINILLNMGLATELSKDTIGKVISFIKETSQTSYLMLLLMELMIEYLNPFVVDANRQKLEALVIEIRLKIEGATQPGRKRDAVRGAITADLKKLRAKSPLADELIE
jgi:predicted MPP superfamily phosphohydrolase